MERFSRRKPNPRIVKLGNIAKFTPPDKCEQVDAFVRGASQLTMSSLALGWRGLVIERHRADASERQEGRHRTTFLPYGRATLSIGSITMGARTWLASPKAQGASIS